MTGQQSLGLKLGQPVETKPASEPVKLPWWQREIYTVGMKFKHQDEHGEIVVAGGKAVQLMPVWFEREYPELVGAIIKDEPELGHPWQMTAMGPSGYPAFEAIFCPMTIKRENIGAPKWWQTEHFRIWFEQGSEESERAIEFKDGKVVALVPGWYAKVHADLVGKALLSEPAVRKSLEVAGADLEPPTWIERHVDHSLMTAEAFLSGEEPGPSYNSRRQWLFEEKRTKESA